MHKTRYSKQRELIYNNLKARVDHPTAEEIYACLKRENPALSLGTVYRNLNFLAEAKLIRKLNVGEQMVHFDANLDSHYHFICQKCHTIYDIDASVATIISDELARNTEHTIFDTSVTMTGICSCCNDKEN